VFKLLNTYFLKSELSSPDSYKVLLQTLLGENTSYEGKLFEKSDLTPLLQSYTDDDTANLVVNALELTGLRGKIILSSHTVNGTSDLLEINNGSFFEDVIPAYSLKATKFLNSKVVCIDGFIESVSEIHRVLNDAAASKENVVIFSRGMADEVIHTMKVNYDRGTVTAIPVIVKYDLLGSNLLNDIAIASGTDVVSNLKGQLISTIDISEIPRVDSIDVTSTGVLIENKSTDVTIDRHIVFLQKKINSAANDAEKSILTKRLQSLGTKRATIRLKESKDKLKRSFEIDQCLRAIKSATTHGVTMWNNMCMPLASVKAGIFYAKQFEKTVDDLGAMIC
jgi:chaperonin GroEL (HSP60 family)